MRRHHQSPVHIPGEHSLNDRIPGKHSLGGRFLGGRSLGGRSLGIAPLYQIRNQARVARDLETRGGASACLCT